MAKRTLDLRQVSSLGRGSYAWSIGKLPPVSGSSQWSRFLDTRDSVTSGDLEGCPSRKLRPPYCSWTYVTCQRANPWIGCALSMPAMNYHPCVRIAEKRVPKAPSPMLWRSATRPRCRKTVPPPARGPSLQTTRGASSRSPRPRRSRSPRAGPSRASSSAPSSGR